MNGVKILMVLFMFFVIACKSNKEKETEKYQKHRNNIINVKDEIVDIKTDLFYGECWLNIIDDILIVNEFFPKGEKGVHLYNKNTFEYITSTAIVGKGPGEVARQGRMAVGFKNRILWLNDHGKKVVWKFPIDSVLKNELYKPTEKLSLNDELFMDRYGFINDSIALGKAVHVISSSSFDMSMARLNVKKNVTKVYGYQHPRSLGKLSNSHFALSVENEIYVNCYCFIDLVTICDLDGNLKCNIIGAGGLENRNGKKSYFGHVGINGKNIIASYNGKERIVYNEFGQAQGNYPTKFIVFDLNGNYIKTIETEFKIINFCVDQENNRLVVCFDGRENPLGYFSLI